VVVDGVAFDGFEAGAVDHFDDLLFGPFHFPPGKTPGALYTAVTLESGNVTA
jgi:hypothetical protein